MSNLRRLHKVYVVFTLFQFIKGLLPLIIITMLRKSGLLGLEWYWYAGATALVLLSLLFGWLEWRAFTYTVEEDRIILRKGVLFKDEKTIYYGRIHSVNVDQPFLQRLLGVAELKIETPGGGKTADGILPALAAGEAEQLRQQLLSRHNHVMEEGITRNSQEEFEKADTFDSDVELRGDAASVSERHVDALFQKSSGHPSAESRDSAYFRLTSGQLLMAAATSLNLGLAIAFIAGIYSFANDFLEKFTPIRFFEQLYTESQSLVPGYFIIVIVIAAIIALAAGWALSLILYIIKYSGFTVKREGKRISVSYGLLNKKAYSFDPDRVQSVIVEEGLLRQWIGYAQIKLQVVSSDKNEQLMLHPFLPITEMEKMIRLFVPQMKWSAIEAKAPKRALFYYMRIWLLLTLVICATLIVIWPLNGLWSLLLLPLVALWRRACHQTAGLTLKDGQLILRRRNFSKVTYLLRRQQILAMTLKRSRAQQRKNLVSLSVQTMGTVNDYSVSLLEYRDMERVWNWYSREGRS